MIFVMRLWTGLIGLFFVLTCSAVVLTFAIASSLVLFVASLAATPFFFFSGDAAGILEKATQIVVWPIEFGAQTTADLWRQLGQIFTGHAPPKQPDEAVRRTAVSAMMATFTAGCYTAVALAPAPDPWKAVAYAAVTGALIVTWALVIAHLVNSDEVDKIATVIALLGITVPASIILAISPIPGKWQVLADLGGAVILLAMWAIGIQAAWNA